MLLGRQMLVAQDDDLVLDQRGFERLERHRIVVLLEIEAMNFRTQPRAQPLDFEGGLAGGCLVGGNVDVHGSLLGNSSFGADYGASGGIFQAGSAARHVVARPD